MDMSGDAKSRPVGRGAERGERQRLLPALTGMEALASVPVSLRASVPSVPSVPVVPPAFLDDYDEEGSEWGWSDWDGVDWRELRLSGKIAGANGTD